mgnify:FL=1
MGATSGLLLRQSIDLCRSVLAIEILVGCEAVEHHRPMKSGEGVEQLIARVREVVPERNVDRSPALDIANIEALIR